MSKNINQAVQDLINDLQKRGIAVENVAVLKLNKEGQVQTPAPSQAATKPATGTQTPNTTQAFSDFLKKYGGVAPKQMQAPKELQNEETTSNLQSDEKCFCPNCLTFDNMEQVLGDKQPAAFDKVEFSLLGQTFQAKYYKGAYGEHMMILRKDFQVDPSWTVEQLQKQFSDALQNKEYDKAQTLLNAIKNQQNPKN